MSKLYRFGKRKGLLAQQPNVTVRVGNMPQMGHVAMPTVAVMPMREAKALGMPVTKIEGHGQQGLPMAIMKAVVKAGKMSRAGMVNVTGTGPYAALMNAKELTAMLQGVGRLAGTNHRLAPGKMRQARFRMQRHGGSDLGVELGSDPDGTPVIVIFSPTPEIPTYRVKHVVRRRDDNTDEKAKKKNGSTPPGGDGHEFLKAPWTDDLLTEAMKKAALALLDESHTGHIKWKEEDEYHVKQYGDIQLLVCLFFYVFVREKYVDSNFFYGQRNTFHQYCSEHLPEGFDVGCDRNFRGCINKLQHRQIGFDEYILADKKPTVAWEKGKANMVFWYEIYRQAVKVFREVFDSKVKA